MAHQQKKNIVQTNGLWPTYFLIRQQNKLMDSLAEHENLALRAKNNLRESSRSVSAGDPGDQSRHTAETFVNARLLEMNPITRIKTALGRILSDLESRNRPHEYGRCKECDMVITARRLEAQPDAPLCCECQSEVEGKAKEFIDSVAFEEGEV